MQPLLDLLPVILFFVTYRLTDIFVATGVLIVAVLIQTAVQWIRHRKVSSVALISAVLVLVFGGLTLIIHDKAFIQWKVTVLDWLLAAGLLASHYFGEQPFTQRLLGQQFVADRSTWLKLSHAWIVFLVALGGLNLYVAYNYPEGVWVTFKLVAIGVQFVYMFATIFWLASKAQQVEGQ
ncbi:MAG TPA: inner membrane-spanning protein YciB [Steroidobacteraceae bacterium]|jgi:intracellular septation protein|nr:inner membrane-spanning protein YciB [Steroidobacteraceae bacterium]